MKKLKELYQWLYKYCFGTCNTLRVLILAAVVLWFVIWAGGLFS